MEVHAKQLIRLAELIGVTAGVLRDLLALRSFDGESGKLDQIADLLEDHAIEIKRVGQLELPS